MIIAKKIFIAVLICFSLNNAFGQSQKFPAPESANSLVNPVKENAQAIEEGKKIYTLYCVTCHGNKGKGDGIAAPGLSKKPADHTSDFVQKQTDGALFWVITNGNNPMPTYKTSLTDLQRWQVIDYIRTLAKHKK